jgi:alanyl-tRNA synthetase
MQAAMRDVLGSHVVQKGSLNNEDNLRFDFSHFAKVTEEEIAQIEKIVNRKIRQNIPVIIQEMPKDEAMKLGAMALFGEKYGDTVRVVIMDENFSIELCGGTHVMHTGELNMFKIISESAVAAGVRRFEALAGCKAEAYIMGQLKQLNDIKTEFKNPKDILGSIKNLQDEKTALQKQLERLEAKALVGIRGQLLVKGEKINGITFIADELEVSNGDALKKLCIDLKNDIQGPYLFCLTANIEGKASVAVSVDDHSSFDAGKIIKEHIAPLIKGGGGGNKTLATAGGQDASQLANIIETVKSLLK